MSLNNTTADALAGTINDGVGGDADSLAKWKIICRAIYSALKTDAVVGTTVTVASVSGVTPGGGVSGPGAGTGTGTLS